MPGKNLMRLVIKRWRACRWQFAHPNHLFVLNWHQVSPEFDARWQQRCTWSSLDRFEAALDYLTTKFRFLPLGEAIAKLSEGQLRGPCVSLTFDDGDISIAEHVEPILRRRGLPATFFVNSAYFDGVRASWVTIVNFLRSGERSLSDIGFSADLLKESEQLRQTRDPQLYNQIRVAIEQHSSLIPNLPTRLVSPEWLASLDEQQFSIGVHGHEHQRFSMMSADWQRRDLQENIRILSQFKAYTPIFAVPFGRPFDWTDDTIEIAHDLRLDVVLANGGVNLRGGRWYNRIPIDGGDAQEWIVNTLAG